MRALRRDGGPREVTVWCCCSDLCAGATPLSGQARLGHSRDERGAVSYSPRSAGKNQNHPGQNQPLAKSQLASRLCFV